jgi:hypothetical protein
MRWQVKIRGGVTICLELITRIIERSGRVDLYPHVLDRLLEIKNLRQHPLSSTKNRDLVFTGVTTDANGFGQAGYFYAEAGFIAAKLNL